MAISPLGDIVRLVGRTENGDFFRSVAPHPRVDHVIVEVVEGDTLGRGAVKKNECPNLLFETKHLPPHVLGPQEGQREVLPYAVRQLLVAVASVWSEIAGKMEPLQLRNQGLREVEPVEEDKSFSNISYICNSSHISFGRAIYAT